MPKRIADRLNNSLERLLPEQRLFLRTDTETRFVRLRPLTQLIALGGSTVVVAFAILSAAVMLMESIGAGNLRERTQQEQAIYQQRLDALASDRDLRQQEAQAAQERFNVALAEVSKMQSELLALEEQRRELESGLEAMRLSLSAAIADRDTARAETKAIRAKLDNLESADGQAVAQAEQLSNTLQFISGALQQTAAERDLIATDAALAMERADALELDRRLTEERTGRIFEQLEDALTVSVEPLDKMFEKAGLSTENLLNQVRSGYSGVGGPLTPITVSTKGGIESAEQIRANAILTNLDRLNMYRIAAEKTPFAVPVKSAFRFTSGYGPRWGRMHKGTDFAASYGTPIHSTADGVVIHAGWSSGYGRLVKIQHEFGIETRYAHMSKIHVKVGQRVSRGDRIGAMGNSGRSTGTHLHYEVRVDGKAVNPMNYIKAARDVF
ncbi:M23 family metallopeptidase [Actibacterium pelagium]|uniref:Peptidase M23 n=1 Tax=Actibacterium pelagium TaxID=2029103 RepID=A0A917ADL5_9RHOB|nr:M23 family metallopeptidase [Actibacterium pelagium]GGE45237.1 peptidase M23 [Actibacterium pelagium]